MEAMADPQAQPIQATPDTKNATISLVMGLVALLVPIIGLVTGILAIVYWRKQKAIAPNGMATAGLVLGIIGLVTNLIFLFLMIVGMIAYFGVLQPDKFLPDKCTTNPPFSCTQYRVTGDDATISISNYAGADMSSAKMTVGCGYDAPAGVPIDLGPIANGGSAQASFSCPLESGRMRASFNIEYMKAGDSISHFSTGSLQARAE
jgi:hypothetical protein